MISMGMPPVMRFSTTYFPLTAMATNNGIVKENIYDIIAGGNPIIL
jgi:hypothetical protein